MNISADEYETKENRSDFFTPVLQTIRSITSWLVGFFTLSEEDRLKAGIHKRGKEHDE